MSTGATCSVYLDGVRLPDGSPEDPPDAIAVALSDLVVSWGRETTVDQPPPSTCSFSVAGSAGTSLFDEFVIGRPIAVTATGIDYPLPSNSTFLDPGFENDAVAASAVNAWPVVQSDVVLDGVNALEILPLDPARAWSVVLPPAPFADHGTSPDAWDEIPTTSLGQTWEAGAWVLAPPGVALTVRPVLFSGPWEGAHQPTELPFSYIGPGWVLVSTEFVPDVAGRWVGLELAAYPTGWSWSDLGFSTPGASWDSLDPAWSWEDYTAVYVDDVTVLCPDAGTERTVLVFAGRVTNLATVADDAIGGPRLDVIAADFLADLANANVGDEPWVVEPMAERFDRILALSGIQVSDEVAVSSLGSTLVSWLDVDNRPAAELLSDLAISVDGIMWAATHQTTGAYLLVEDPAARLALYRLELVDGVVVISIAGAGTVLSACDVLRDPITFVQDVSDVVTRAAISWQEQTVDDDGVPAPTERTEMEIDAELELVHGVRRISVSTQLVAAQDALDVASRLLARLTVDSWRASGFTVDDDDLEQDSELLLRLLDGTSRIGLPVTVTDLPSWSPAGAFLPVYLEGGAYHYADGRWVLELVVSAAKGQGSSTSWSQLDPAWSWSEFDPTISWSDLFGVAGPDPLESP